MMNRPQMIKWLRDNVTRNDFVNGKFDLPVELVPINETPWQKENTNTVTIVWCAEMGSSIKEGDIYSANKVSKPKQIKNCGSYAMVRCVVGSNDKFKARFSDGGIYTVDQDGEGVFLWSDKVRVYESSSRFVEYVEEVQPNEPHADDDLSRNEAQYIKADLGADEPCASDETIQVAETLQIMDATESFAKKYDNVLVYCRLNKVYGYVVGCDLYDGAAGYLHVFDGEDVTCEFKQIEFSSLDVNVEYVEEVQPNEHCTRDHIPYQGDGVEAYEQTAAEQIATPHDNISMFFREITYDNMKRAGWTDEQLISEGYITLPQQPKPDSPWNTQVGGTHYTDKAMQPLQLTLLNRGYEAFSGACYTKINKYTTRAKDDEVEQLKKARHVLDLWIYEAEQKSDEDVS